jgi:hypothetical protein
MRDGAANSMVGHEFEKVQLHGYFSNVVLVNRSDCSSLQHSKGFAREVLESARTKRKSGATHCWI